MKRYIKNIDGKDVIKYSNEIIVIHGENNEWQTINPSEELILSDGWVEYVVEPYIPTEEELFNRAKKDKIREVERYDNSEEVNICYIKYGENQLPYWADKNERSVLKTAINDCLTIGRETYRLDLRDLDIYLTLPCELLLTMLAQLEVYAIDCYNTTSDHLHNINLLTTKEEIDNYDYTVNYPEKLIFTI